MLGPSLRRTSTYPASTSRGLCREPASRKGLRYKTKSFRAYMNGDITSLCESHFIENHGSIQQLLKLIKNDE